MFRCGAAIRHGLKGFAIAAALENIEGWEAKLEKVDAPAARTIAKDLEALKRHLRAGKLDGGRIRTLVLKLGRDTAAIAGHAEGGTAARIKALGEALTSAAKSARTE